MSRKNKVNPDHYKVAGRLTPDDLARERQVQAGNVRETASDHDRAVAKRLQERAKEREASGQEQAEEKEEKNE
jgi:hypothetical protein